MNVWTQTKAVAQKAWNGPKYVWNSLKKSWEVVEGAAKTAHNWIKGNFTHSATFSGSRLGTLSGHDEGGQTALHGSHAGQEGHSHSATHGGGNDWAKKRTGN